MGAEKPRDFVKKGDMAYWPLGKAICIFLDDMRPYSPVNLIGQVTEGIDLLAKVKSGTKMRIVESESGGPGGN
ncbi:MAG: cyclophilin-like family protein [Thermoproteota archaeon]